MVVPFIEFNLGGMDDFPEGFFVGKFDEQRYICYYVTEEDKDGNVISNGLCCFNKEDDVTSYCSQATAEEVTLEQAIEIAKERPTNVNCLHLLNAKGEILNTLHFN